MPATSSGKVEDFVERRFQGVPLDLGVPGPPPGTGQGRQHEGGRRDGKEGEKGVTGLDHERIQDRKAGARTIPRGGVARAAGWELYDGAAR